MRSRHTLLSFVASATLPALAITFAVAQGRITGAPKASTFTVDGIERTYRAVSPASEHPMPLVLVLHGGGAGERAAIHLIRATGFGELAVSEGFIAAFPVGIGGNWNDGRDVEFIQAQREGVDDVKFLRGVVDEIAKTHPVDRSRIFATGISNGAFMSHRLAAEASDLVAAVAPVVGGMSLTVAAAFRPEHPVSLLVIQGDSDPLIPIGGGAVGFKGGRERGQLLPTEETLAKYIKRNGNEAKPVGRAMPDRDPEDGTTTAARVYPTGETGAKVQLYLVEGGGHTWPGAKPYLTEKLVGKTSRDFDATEAIWEFFKSCPPRKGG